MLGSEVLWFRNVHLRVEKLKEIKLHQGFDFHAALLHSGWKLIQRTRMSQFLIAAIAIVFFMVMIGLRKRKKQLRQAAFVDAYIFPTKLKQQLQLKYPHLSDAECERVFAGLREFFHINRMARKRQVAMPSQVVDEVWHELILFTRHYDAFCKQALGRFLHHTPAEAMKSPTHAQDGIRRAWRLSCLREGIDPQNPKRLPLLFALDSELNIADGFVYHLNCKGLKDQGYCASHIGCGGGCSGGCSSDSSGCGGGGCGGD